jgi:hypothetical protein
MAKEETSTPKRFRKGSPAKRKSSMRTKETRVALSASICPVFRLISIIIGIDPVISITANNTMKTVIISTNRTGISNRFESLNM